MSTQLLPDDDPFGIEAASGGGPEKEGPDQAPGSRNAHFMRGAKSGGGSAGEASEAGGMGADLGELAEVAAVAA